MGLPITKALFSSLWVIIYLFIWVIIFAPTVIIRRHQRNLILEQAQKWKFKNQGD